MTPKQRFVELCRHFLTAFYPRYEREIVILDCVLAVPDELIPDAQSLRHMAHAFVHAALDLRERKEPHMDWMGPELQRWLREWMKENR